MKHHFLALLLCFAAVALRADGIFPVDTLHAYSPDCQSANVCLPIPAADFSDYLIFQNGSPFASGVAGCDFDTTITYSYNTLLGLGNMGPYHLDAWTVNGQTHDGIFMNINDLVGMLNQWDPTGFWAHDPATLSIKGGTSGSGYSDMEVTVMANSTQSIIGLNFGLLPQGSEMEFQVGLNSIIAIDFATNTKDTPTGLGGMFGAAAARLFLRHHPVGQPAVHGLLKQFQLLGRTHYNPKYLPGRERRVRGLLR